MQINQNKKHTTLYHVQLISENSQFTVGQDFQFTLFEEVTTAKGFLGNHYPLVSRLGLAFSPEQPVRMTSVASERPSLLFKWLRMVLRIRYPLHGRPRTKLVKFKCRVGSLWFVYVITSHAKSVKKQSMCFPMLFNNNF